MGNKFLSINDILNTDDLKEIEIEVPEWGGKIKLREMSGASLDAYDSGMWKLTKGADGKIDISRDTENARAKMIAASVVGADGALMFKSDAHIKALGNKNGKVLDRIYRECQKLNGVNAEEQEETEAKSEASQD